MTSPPQLAIINKVRQLAELDALVSALLLYGSFIKGEGDEYSDVEFYVFHRESMDALAFISRIMAVEVFFTNEFGTEVAIFANLIRGEFHFLPIDQIGVIHTWVGHVSFEFADKMNLVDKDGLLARTLAPIDKTRPRHDSAEHCVWLANSLINNLLLARNLLCRGELAHCHHHFQYIHKYLVWLIRIVDRADNHWEGPTKRLEREISAEWYQQYATCLPSLNRDSLIACLNNSVLLGGKICGLLAVPDNLLQLLGRLDLPPGSP